MCNCLSSCNTKPSQSSAGNASCDGGTTCNPCTPCTLSSETVSTARTNRARTKVGVAERVVVRVQPNESVTWSVTGGGTINPTSGTSTTFTAGDRASTSVLKATRSDGCTCTITFNVVEPDGAYQVQFGKTVHTNGTASAGFRGITYLTPKDVSFENIEINEGTVAAVATGIRAPDNGKMHPAWSSWATVGGGSDSTGSVVQGPNQTGSTYWDFVFTNIGTGPWGAGTFRWDIPWEFRVSGGAKKQFTTLTHLATYEASGRVTMSKDGVSVSAVPADGTETP